MKNLWKLILCFFIASMSFSSCELLDEFKKDNKEEKEEEKVTHNPLLFGVWKYGGGIPSKYGFNEDGSGYQYVPGNSTQPTFVWESSDTEIWLNYDRSPREEHYRYKLEDNNQSLYWYDIDSGKLVNSLTR